MAEQTLKEKTAKGLFWGGISNGVQQVLNLVFGLVLARILNASDYGMVGMLAIFSAIASTIQESGFTAALTNQKEIRHEDYNAVFWFSTLTGVFFYLVLFFCAPLIAHFYDKPELIGLSRVVFLGFLFSGLGTASNAYLFKTLMVKERAKIDIISLVCAGMVGITLALNGFAYYGLAIQTVTYIGVGSLLKLFYTPWKPCLIFNFYPLKEMFTFSLRLLLTNIFVQINTNLFSVILGKFYTPKQLGLYSQGQKWMMMGQSFIGGMINNIAQPVLVQVEDKDQQKNVFRKIIRFGAFVSFPLMFGLAFIGHEFINIFLGEKWNECIPFLQLFCFWGAFGYLWNLYTYLLLIYNRTDVYFWGILFTGILQILSVLLIFRFGVLIMVIGYIVCNFIGLMFLHYFVNKLISIKLMDVLRDIIPYIGLLLVSFFISLLLIYPFSNIYIILVLKVFIVAFIYLFSLRLLGSVILHDCILFVKGKLYKLYDSFR